MSDAPLEYKINSSHVKYYIAKMMIEIRHMYMFKLIFLRHLRLSASNRGRNICQSQWSLWDEIFYEFGV